MRQSRLENISVISNQASEELAQKVAKHLGINFTEIERKQFKDGEIYHRLPTQNITGKDVVIVASTHTDSSHQELMDLIEGCQYWDAASVNIVVPYLGYSTMERAKADSGEIPKGITRTRQLLRTCPDFAAFIDLHSEAVMHTHSGAVRTAHLQTDDLVVEKIKEIAEQHPSKSLKDFVLVSPDYGRSKWVAKIAGKLGIAHTAADKDRFAQDQTMVGQVSAVVRDKVAIICDDMIRTGGSISQTGARCKQAGANEIMFMATHLVLAGDAREILKNAGANKIIGADTYPHTETDELIEVYSVATLIASRIAKHLNLAQ